MTTDSSSPPRLSVDLGERSYDIIVGDGLLARVGGFVKPLLCSGEVIVVSDDNVASLYLEVLRNALADAGVAAREVVVPAGEQSKDFRHLESVIDTLLEFRAERRDAIIALGGGVVGDLAGFAASIFRRGVDLIQIPTTLLAQVDSSVGGKTGINTRQGKNLVGTFHQPRLVVADTRLLETLPRRQILAGYAEVAKYGLIDDPSFFAWLEDHGAAVCAGDPLARREAVSRSCAAKARIVVGDERESGRRALLNLGHTFAHAMEVESGYGEVLLHGEAVAVGIVLAYSLSARMGLCPRGDVERVRRHFALVGLPTSLGEIGERPMDPASLLAHMAQDKKVRAGRGTFVLARGIGKAFLSRSVDLADVRARLDESLGACPTAARPEAWRNGLADGDNIA